jgi:protein AFG1
MLRSRRHILRVAHAAARAHEIIGSIYQPPSLPAATIVAPSISSSSSLLSLRFKSEEARVEDDSEPSFSATELAGLAAKLVETAYTTPGGQKIAGTGPLLAYTEGKEEGLLRSDPKQEITVRALQNLYDNLVEAIPAPSSRGGSGLTLIDAADRSDGINSHGKPWWKSLFGTQKTEIENIEDEYEPEVQGLYMFGGVGCGKTMLMDLFAACAPTHFRLERTHFHDFMLDVHSRLRTHQSTPDPLSLVAAEITSSCRVLCLDEFFVTDVADAMILHRLFAKLWEHDLVLVATSNRHPDALYEGGLQRALFLPFISKLKRACIVHDMASPTDYRKLAHHRGGLYFISEDRENELQERFIELANNNPVGSQTVDVAMGRTLEMPRTGGCITQFTFDELCNRPLGAADYIALANAKHTIALFGVPKFDGANRTAAYRFVTLIDVLYEHRVRFLCSAESMPLQLFENIKTNQEAKAASAASGNGSSSPDASEMVVDDNLGFAKDRTISRLTEMQSKEYLRAHAERHAPELLYALDEAEKRETK